MKSLVWVKVRGAPAARKVRCFPSASPLARSSASASFTAGIAMAHLSTSTTSRVFLAKNPILPCVA